MAPCDFEVTTPLPVLILPGAVCRWTGIFGIDELAVEVDSPGRLGGTCPEKRFVVFGRLRLSGELVLFSKAIVNGEPAIFSSLMQI
jgi:hypothetical protein